MHKVKINRSDFKLSFELGSDDTTAYLDVETGDVLVVEDYTADRLEDLVTEDATLEGIEAAVESDERRSGHSGSSSHCDSIKLG